jgi:hypothetical protein
MSEPDGAKCSPGGAHPELSLDSLIAAISATGQQPADADALWRPALLVSLL